MYKNARKKMYYENNVIRLCSDYAAVSHIGQFRKDKITPYITHPARVSCMVSESKNASFREVCAAWLHDVLEDCSEIINSEYSYIIKNHKDDNKDIRIFLLNNKEIDPPDGKIILELVEALTTSQNKKIPKKERRENSYKNILRIPDAALIKYCDRIDNLMTVNHFSDGGRKWYLKDTENMISNLDKFVYSDFIKWKLLSVLPNAIATGNPMTVSINNKEK